MSLINCDIGTLIKIKGTMTDEAEQPVVGASVTAKVLAPSGTQTDLGACTDEGNGVYSVEFKPTEPGNWSVRMDSAPPDQAGAEGNFYVRETRFS